MLSLGGGGGGWNHFWATPNPPTHPLWRTRPPTTRPLRGVGLGYGLRLEHLPYACPTEWRYPVLMFEHGHPFTHDWTPPKKYNNNTTSMHRAERGAASHQHGPFPSPSHPPNLSPLPTWGGRTIKHVPGGPTSQGGAGQGRVGKYCTGYTQPQPRPRWPNGYQHRKCKQYVAISGTKSDIGNTLMETVHALDPTGGVFWLCCH